MLYSTVWQLIQDALVTIWQIFQRYWQPYANIVSISCFARMWLIQKAVFVMHSGIFHNIVEERQIQANLESKKPLVFFKSAEVILLILFYVPIVNLHI
jgi:hypothetical protein